MAADLALSATPLVPPEENELATEPNVPAYGSEASADGSLRSTEKGEDTDAESGGLCARAPCGMAETSGNKTCKKICNHTRKRKRLLLSVTES